MNIALENTEPLPSDNMGPLLDTVRLSVVPAPAAVWVGGFGVGLAGWLKGAKWDALTVRRVFTYEDASDAV